MNAFARDGRIYGSQYFCHNKSKRSNDGWGDIIFQRMHLLAVEISLASCDESISAAAAVAGINVSDLMNEKASLCTVQLV
jgi:hypothetical protein